MVKTTLEIAVRFEWDPTKPISAEERDLMLEAMTLARKEQALRGAGPGALGALDRIEDRVRSIPLAAVGAVSSSVAASERQVIAEALGRGLSIEKTAAALGIAPGTLYARMRRYGLTRPGRAPQLVVGRPACVEKNCAS